MSGTRTIPLRSAQEIAQDLLTFLSPYCQQIAIVGSVRRQRPVVGDLELLCIPLATSQSDMFGTPVGSQSQLDDGLDKLLLTQRVWHWDKQQPRRGRQWKRLIYAGSATMSCDLFIVTRRTWAGHLIVRTGPSGFCQHVMGTARRVGWHFADGFLLHRHAPPCDRGPDCPYILEMKTERDIMEALELPWREPNEREGFPTTPPRARK